MNNLTDAEISRRLALAIGHEYAINCANTSAVYVPFDDTSTKRFDYRDPAVIWPIAERFDAFPHKRVGADGWTSVTEDAWLAGETFSVANTAAKAVALAVIKSKEQQ